MNILMALIVLMKLITPLMPEGEILQGRQAERWVLISIVIMSAPSTMRFHHIDLLCHPFSSLLPFLTGLFISFLVQSTQDSRSTIREAPGVCNGLLQHHQRRARHRCCACCVGGTPGSAPTGRPSPPPTAPYSRPTAPSAPPTATSPAQQHAKVSVPLMSTYCMDE